MRKIPRFLLIFIALLVLSVAGAVLFHWQISKVDQDWLLYESLASVLTYLPLIAAVSVVWALVFKGQSEINSADSAFILQFLFFILFNLGFAFIINEIALPALEQRTLHARILKKTGLKEKPRLKDIQEGKIKAAEIKNLKYFPYKENIAFKMSRAVVSMERLYKADQIFYIQNFRIFGYDKNGRLYYVITSPFAKEVGGQILALNPVYFDVSGGSVRRTRSVQGQKMIPLIYDINGIYSLSPGQKNRNVSLVNIVRYQDFIFNSGINFHYISGLVYNKISYYMILILLMIVSASMGKTLKNQRATTGKDIVRIILSYAVSLLLMVLSYDMLVRLSNMIQGLII